MIKRLILIAALAVISHSAQASGPSRGYTSTQIFSTMGSTKDEGEPNHAGEPGGASEWYVYSPPTNGILQINTDGSSYNTVLAVYTGSGFGFDTLSLVADDNSSSGNGGDRVRFSAQEGVVYFIAVDGVGGASGTVQLNINLGEAPVFITAPQSVSKQIGQSATFTTDVSGSTNFYYQWQFNGAAISGATQSTFTVPVVAVSNEGTYTVAVSNLVDVVVSSPAVLTIIPSPENWEAINGDFDGNNRIDILWRHKDPAIGSNRLWRMGYSGTNVIDKASPLLSSMSTWAIGAVADLTGDGKSDIVWRQPGNTNTAVWVMNGTQRTGSLLLQKGAGTNWTLSASGDMDGDGKADLLWRDYSNGKNAIWFMDGTNFISSQLTLTCGTNWVLAGASDFDGDGKTDIVWRDRNGPEASPIAYWYMDGTNRLSAVTLPWEPDVAWAIRGVGDFNQDGDTDLVWFNRSTGAASLWLMNNTNRLSNFSLGWESDLDWQIVGPK